MLVSAVEAAANCWKKESGGDIERLELSKPSLHKYLTELVDKNVLPFVASQIADSLGSTKKFVDFLSYYLPQTPVARPPEGFRLEWSEKYLKKAFARIYGYRSRALHDGKPFPIPMCEGPFQDPNWEAPCETVIGFATGSHNAVWMREDTPMHFNMFEYIARSALMSWWQTTE
jgi:hypothetical protein